MSEKEDKSRLETVLTLKITNGVKIQVPASIHTMVYD
jgi:hypothetical protein